MPLDLGARVAAERQGLAQHQRSQRRLLAATRQDRNPHLAELSAQGLSVGHRIGGITRQGRPDQTVEKIVDQVVKNRLFAGEIEIEGPLGHTGGRGDIRHPRGVKAPRLEHLDRSGGKPVAGCCFPVLIHLDL